jgi:hypothetical protein
VRLAAAFGCFAALVLWAVTPLSAADEAPSIEQQLAACIYEREPELLLAIRDAANEEEFVAAFRRAVELCEFPEQEYSLGRFFDAVNALAGPPEYSE